PPRGGKTVIAHAPGGRRRLVLAERPRIQAEARADPTIRNRWHFSAVDRAAERNRFDGWVVYAMLMKAAGREPPRRRRRR
ncbi:hypothetical protein, partial [Paludisphaera soli]|uniref:hypothetical protein n=1 Tax=Paludisphaera soli TaxID=2712865 RepID=UPI00197E4DD0